MIPILPFIAACSSSVTRMMKGDTPDITPRDGNEMRMFLVALLSYVLLGASLFLMLGLVLYLKENGYIGTDWFFVLLLLSCMTFGFLVYVVMSRIFRNKKM